MSLAATSVIARPRTANLVAQLVVAFFIVSVAMPGRTAPHATENRPLQLLGDYNTDIAGAAGSMYNVVREVGAPTFWWSGYTGAGVDVALIDSGVAPVPGLDRAGKIVYGPDVSFESGVDGLHNLDTFGHGTHMAGIIAGRGDGFRGVAPGARIVSLKAADALGRSSVGQVIAAIKWVVEHRTANGLNIRVLNLSFGASRVQSYEVDDLAYAVEQAWQAGIAVVVSAGNDGAGSNGLADPAFDPYVIAVGADNPQGTTDVSDDNVTSFSSRGDGQRDPDIIAPGKSVLSLRVPGSYLDQSHPDARVGDNLFRGSGTSQAAAVVSGVAALIIDQRPRITPDQLKALLQSTAQLVPGATYQSQGSGLVSLSDAYRTWTTRTAQSWTASAGSEGNPWASADATGNSWSIVDTTGNSWSSNFWTGSGWEGPGWTDVDSISGNSWSSDNWLGVSWGKKKGR